MTAWNVAELRALLADRLTLDELRAISFDLGFPEEAHPSKDAQVRAMLTHLVHRQALDQLIAWIQHHRPDIDTASLVATNAANAPATPTTQQDGGADWTDLLGRVRGDVIIAEIGSQARNVAVGKHITQTNVTADSDALADGVIISQRLADVRAQLAPLQPALDPLVLQMVEFQLDLLTGELMKPAGGDAPSANAITRAGGWLMDHVPSLQPHLRALFQTPAVTRVLGRAGESAVTWAGRVFGGTTGQAR